MAGRVIQGFFIGGAMRPQPVPRAEARPRHPTGAPTPAFAGGAAPLQARMTSGRPPLAHQGSGPVAQPHGGNGSFEIDPARLGLARGGGKPLPQAVLARMEAAFEADFSSVRVHVGPQASRIGAIAFTTGNDIYFAPGRFQPESVHGQQLLGHELAHVIQQRQGRVRAPGAGVAVVQDKALEAEADRLGARAAAGAAARVQGAGVAETVQGAGVAETVQPAMLGSLAAAGALGLGYAAYRAYSYFSATPVYSNKQAAHYPQEVGSYLEGWRSTRTGPYTSQVFRELFVPGNALPFRNRVRSGVRFIWALRTNGILGIGSMEATQHPIAASGADVVAAGEGQLMRAVNNPALTVPHEAAAARFAARQNRRKALRKMMRTHAGLSDPYPFVSVRNFLDNAAYQDGEANQLQGGAAGVMWQGPQDDVVYLNLKSGHYHPELSGRVLSSRAWSSAMAAWQTAGFRALREPGSHFT